MAGHARVVYAPFQQLEFTEKFDLIVCIDMLEYSALFIHEEDPYEHVLRYFGELLSADGRVIIAIENQFGLKYFSSSREDQLKLMFEGIEGYPLSGLWVDGYFLHTQCITECSATQKHLGRKLSAGSGMAKEAGKPLSWRKNPARKLRRLYL